MYYSTYRFLHIIHSTADVRSLFIHPQYSTCVIIYIHDTVYIIQYVLSTMYIVHCTICIHYTIYIVHRVLSIYYIYLDISSLATQLNSSNTEFN